MNFIIRLMLAVVFFSFQGVNSDDSVVEKWLLPVDHPLQKKLKSIFRKTTHRKFNSTLMLEAGFSIISRPNTKGVLVATHPGMKDYVFKFYNNRKGTIPEEDVFLQRIVGAESIRQKINESEFVQFAVPKKWIFRVPKKGGHSILIAENMNILPHKKNMKAWKSSAVDVSLITNLYKIIKDLGLNDSVYIDNIPFNKEGKVCFIDTEHYGNWPVPFSRLNGVLGERIRQKWVSLYTEN
ncbi:MAG: hypothetical protein VX777_04995 [Chlamydiota bacterium]|nr:hypothetical protein [Chlamydiota bacterium]